MIATRPTMRRSTHSGRSRSSASSTGSQPRASVIWSSRIRSGDAEYARLRAACDARHARLFVATLAPPQAIAASDRGTRTLTEWERQRVAEMYRKGYASRAFSDCFVDTSTASVAACAADIARRIQ